ncbi:hypothetical protein NDU88_001009 [Pleurodeles waltl]|uniref:Uncharacterized protein n=1 Tax=Pleurodeles waltl TaxID=8319 RepID=A0AAV7N9Q6_PLEWA|nr:hypothetical protein NDU88_001009 [Pleurodeles waltl]
MEQSCRSGWDRRLCVCVPAPPVPAVHPRCGALSVLAPSAFLSLQGGRAQDRLRTGHVQHMAHGTVRRRQMRGATKTTKILSYIEDKDNFSARAHA